MENGKIKVWLPAIRAGTGVDVFTRRLAQALERRGIIAQITWFPLHYEFIPFLLRYTKLPIGVDIVFANSWNGFAFKHSGIPLVVTLHHGGFDSASRRYRNLLQKIYHRFLIYPFERKSLEAADMITAVSQFSAASLQQTIPLEKIRVLHNWIDTQRFSPAPEYHQQAIQTGRPFRLLYVGKLSRLKGVDLLAPIMRRLGADFELSIVSGSKSIKNDTCSPNIRMLGWLNEEELIRTYQGCDALLFPSRSEGFGYVALEAMACGKPVIATNITALPEVVIHDVTGILCPIDDIDAFVMACQRLVADRDLCSRMGLAARQRAVDYYSEKQVIGKYLTLINKLLTPNRVTALEN